MRLSDFLRPDCIRVPLQSAAKGDAITELSELLARAHHFDDPGFLTQAVLDREKKANTGIGHGIAVPHGRLPGISDLKLAIGIARPGLEYGSMDRKPAEVLILLISPADQPAIHIQALARVSRMLTDESLRNRIKSAPDAAAVHAIFAAFDDAASN